MDLKISKGHCAIEKDPFLILGYGVNAYFDILNQLFACFICVTIFSLPMLVLYN